MLDGKAVVVTGAGRNIGAAYARAAAAEGASVVVNDVDSEAADGVAAEIGAAGGRAVAHAADVTSWVESGGLIDRCVAEFGRIDGLVNNAAIFWIGRPEEATEDAWRRIVEVNVLGLAFCGQHALRRMQVQGGGSIVNVTSGAHAGIPLQSLYGASKGAVASLTYAWAVDLREHGIRVNAISPMAQSRMSDMVKKYFLDRGEEPWPDLTIPPSVNAPVVVFLLSDEADGITGQVVRVEGNRLSIMTHPAVLHPALVRESWTPELVRDAFATDFRARLLPLGVVAIDGRVREYGVSYLPADDGPTDKVEVD